MTSNLLTVPFLQSIEVVQSLPVREGLVSRKIMSVITMMTAGTILMSLFAVRQSICFRLIKGDCTVRVYCISAYGSFIVPGSYTTRCDFSQGPCDWTQSTEDDFNWSRRRGEYYDII